jgi:hypothetical protein
MLAHISVALAVAIVSAIAVVCAFPAFPPADALLDSSYSSLVSRFGAPFEPVWDMRLPEKLRPQEQLKWRRSRLFADWELEVAYTVTPFEPTARPDTASRCLVWKWVDFHMPCDYVFRGRVLVP